MNTFTTPREHGAREWKTFNPIREDHTNSYRIPRPQNPSQPRRPGIIEIITHPGRTTPGTAH